MKEHAPTPTGQDQRDLQQIKEAVRGRLQKQRAISELIWDNARDLCEADRRGLWKLDQDFLASLRPRKGQRGRKKEGPTREEWAAYLLGVSVRHARKFFTVGNGLRREEVAGTGLCLDRLEQLGLAPPEIRDLVRSMGVAGFTPGALSAGRRAAQPFLDEGDLPGAREAVLKEAERADRREARRDPPRPPRTEAVDPPTGLEAACLLANEALTEAEALQDVPAEELDPAALDRLAVLGERIMQAARQAREASQAPARGGRRIQPGGARHGPGVRRHVMRGARGCGT